MLNNGALSALAARGVQVPTHVRHDRPGVVHLGLGAFHRAHQALVFGHLLDRGDGRWGVFGVAMHKRHVTDALRSQDGLYSVQLAATAGVRWQVCGAIGQTCVAAEEPQTVVAAMAALSTRWVTLTVTEKGYAPPLAALLVQGLAARRNAGLGGLTLASCDNLAGNGRVLQSLCVQAARAHDASLADWIEGVCAFPNSMVDRIVPAASATTLQQAQHGLGLTDHAALRTEEFWEWVIERHFVDNSDAAVLATAGVQVVDDVRPFEDAKLRLLNGSHSAMACIGAVAGLPLVSDCMAQAPLRDFIHGLMTHEIGPLLARPHWADYRDALLLRFANPHLQHSVHQIASDSSLKVALRWVPAAVAALQAGLPVTRLAFCAAAWMRYCQGTDDAGQTYALSDPNAATLQSTARAHAASASATFDHLGTLPAVWGDVLPRHPYWRSLVINHLQAIQSHSLLASVAMLAPQPAQLQPT